MPLIAGHQVVGPCSIGALDEFVIVGVLGHLNQTRWADRMRVPFDELDKLLTRPLTNLKLGPGEHFSIPFEDGFGNIESCRLVDGKEQNGSLRDPLA